MRPRSSRVWPQASHQASHWDHGGKPLEELISRLHAVESLLMMKFSDPRPPESFSMMRSSDPHASESLPTMRSSGAHAYESLPKSGSSVLQASESLLKS
jgi:hypothetical protein